MVGLRILQKNNRDICPLDMAPELRKLQESCVERLFTSACCPPSQSKAAAATSEDSISVC